jgi:myo-inositol 2-dehydrogenase / D-chiro-inositol 1-dehydrogenase
MPTEDRAFIHAVAGGRPDLIESDYENGIRNLAVTIAADRSARTNAPVDVARLLAEEAPNVL